MRGFFVCKNIVTALKEVEQRFDRAVRGTTDGIWDWNIDTGRCIIRQNLPNYWASNLDTRN